LARQVEPIRLVVYLYQGVGSGARRRGKPADQSVRRRGMCEKGQQQTERTLRAEQEDKCFWEGGRSGCQARAMRTSTTPSAAGRRKGAAHTARCGHKKPENRMQTMVVERNGRLEAGMRELDRGWRTGVKIREVQEGDLTTSNWQRARASRERVGMGSAESGREKRVGPSQEPGRGFWAGSIAFRRRRSVFFAKAEIVWRATTIEMVRRGRELSATTSTLKVI
jgi:hypothetical protein